MSLVLRRADSTDAELIVEFIKALALYEKEPESAIVTESDIIRDGFSENPKFHAIIAEWDGKPSGFMFYFYNYSTWEGRPGIYLEDLFVYPDFRGKGIGKALLLKLAEIAKKEMCTRLVWQVLDWNTPSLDFYDAMGAKQMKEWITCRVEKQRIETLANDFLNLKNITDLCQ